jgi:hypothetical protein
MDVEMIIKQLESLTPEEKRQVQGFIQNHQDESTSMMALRKPNLHPDAMKIAPDFDAPLPEEFWNILTS